MDDSIAGLDGSGSRGALEAQPGYTRNPRDTRDRQSSRFDRWMARVSRQRKQQSLHVYIIMCSHHVYISYNRKSRHFSVNFRNARHCKSLPSIRFKLKLWIVLDVVQSQINTPSISFESELSVMSAYLGISIGKTYAWCVKASWHSALVITIN